MQADINLNQFGLSLTGIDIIDMAPGVCGIMLGGSCILMIAAVIMAGSFNCLSVCLFGCLERCKVFNYNH